MATQHPTNESTLELYEDQELEQLINTVPLDSDTVDVLERVAASNTVGINRRLMLGAQSVSIKKLSEFSVEEPEAYQNINECVECFAQHTTGLHEVSKAALLRMQIADCRNTQDEAHD